MALLKRSMGDMAEAWKSEDVFLLNSCTSLPSQPGNQHCHITSKKKKNIPEAHIHKILVHLKNKNCLKAPEKKTSSRKILSITRGHMQL